MPFVSKRKKRQAEWHRNHVKSIRERKEFQFHSHPKLLLDLNDRANLTIIDSNTSATILQRISPPSASTQVRLNTKLKEGIPLIKGLIKAAKECGNASKSKHDNVPSTAIHLGISHQSGKSVGWTEEHQSCRPASDDMLAWIHKLFQYHIYPMESFIEEDFREKLDSRSVEFNWLQEKMPKGECKSLHKWYTMATVIQGYPPTEKYNNDRDASPSILINFGNQAKFTIDGIVVFLHHTDFLIYDASKDHKVEIGQDGGEFENRFAINLSMRNDIVPCIDATQSAQTRAKRKFEGPD